MEHPLIQVDPDATVEDLQQRITDLNKKLSFAMRSGNAHLANQLRMALATFNEVYQKKLREISDRNNKGIDYGDKIDIS